MGHARQEKKIKQAVRREARIKINAMVDKMKLVVRAKPRLVPLFIWVGLIKIFFKVNPRDPVTGGDFDTQQNTNDGIPGTESQVA